MRTVRSSRRLSRGGLPQYMLGYHHPQDQAPHPRDQEPPQDHTTTRQDQASPVDRQTPAKT